MIEALISSKTRIKILLKFFLNSNTSSYLRSLEEEFDESTNGIRKELNRLEDAGLLSSFAQGNKKLFKANISHPLFSEVNNIIKKHVGLDKIVDNVVERLGNVQEVYLMGDFARGKNSQIIDLLFVGDLDINYLISLIDKVEDLITRKIRYLIMSEKECFDFLKNKTEENFLLIWSDNEQK